MILRIILISLIKWIGEDTHSAQLKSITNGIFVVLFCNTGFLVLLAYANMGEFSGWFASFFNNYYYDFTANWYTVVGYSYLKTLLINCFFPFVEFGIAYSQSWLFRKLDKGKGKDEYSTKLTSMQLYIDLYSGPEYQIHFRYSGILNVTFVCMMYGVGLPIFFGVASLTYFILYSFERILVAYFYQLPPTFDDQMTKNVVKIMRWAVLFHLFVGYWMLSNKQIF